jgi:hypothetical protein
MYDGWIAGAMIALALTLAWWSGRRASSDRLTAERSPYEPGPTFNPPTMALDSLDANEPPGL